MGIGHAFASKRQAAGKNFLLAAQKQLFGFGFTILWFSFIIMVLVLGDANGRDKLLYIG